MLDALGLLLDGGDVTLTETRRAPARPILGCVLVGLLGGFGCGLCAGLQLAISVYSGHW